MLDLYEQSARILEKYFGEYPWIKERIGASETPHLGMEHQTNIAYGNKYKFKQQLRILTSCFIMNLVMNGGQIK